MMCHSCRIEAVKAGKGRNQIQRYKCQRSVAPATKSLCGKRFSGPQEKPFGVDVRLPKDTVIRILHCLVEGTSVRATARLCDVEPNTVLAMLKLAGENCERIMGRKVRNVKVADVQADEIWGFVQKKEAHKRPAEAHDNSIGDAYTFVAIERDSKLVLNFALGRRDTATNQIFIEGLRDAIAPGLFQISTDGFAPYVPAIDDTLGHRVDYAQIIKTYGNNDVEGQRRYSPPEVVDIQRKVIIGKPDQSKICTSHIERSNLTMRMHMRRLTRLTNAFTSRVGSGERDAA
jgi:IS1 family transposase/transposase-like protein